MRNCAVFPLGESRMVGKLWRATKVTVREGGDARAELARLSRLTHPHILLLMGVCHTNTASNHLVFQHVQLGSLHHWMHVQVPSQNNETKLAGVWEPPPYKRAGLRVAEVLLPVRASFLLICSLCSVTHNIWPERPVLPAFSAVRSATQNSLPSHHRLTGLNCSLRNSG